MSRHLGVLAVLLVLASAGGARAQLSAESRARISATARGQCMQSAAQSAWFVGVSRKSIATICGCASARIAATLDIDALRAAMANNTISEWTQDTVSDAVQYCMDRHGGFIPGATVTPNH